MLDDVIRTALEGAVRITLSYGEHPQLWIAPKSSAGRCPGQTPQPAFRGRWPLGGAPAAASRAPCPSKVRAPFLVRLPCATLWQCSSLFHCQAVHCLRRKKTCLKGIGQRQYPFRRSPDATLVDGPLSAIRDHPTVEEVLSSVICVAGIIPKPIMADKHFGYPLAIYELFGEGVEHRTSKSPYGMKLDAVSM